MFRPRSCSIFLNFLTNQTTFNCKLSAQLIHQRKDEKKKETDKTYWKTKERERKFTKLLQLMHLRLGGSFMRPRIIFSFRSSSLLLPISQQLESYGVGSRNPRSFFEKTEAELEELQLIVQGSRTDVLYRKWTVSGMKNLFLQRRGTASIGQNSFLFFFRFFFFF